MYEVLHPQQLSHIKDSNLLIFTYKILCKDIFYKRSFKYSDGYYVPVSWCKINSCWFINWKNKKVYEHSNHRNTNLVKSLNNDISFNYEAEMMNLKSNTNRSLLFININNENTAYEFLGSYKKDVIGNNILVEFSKELQSKLFKDTGIINKSFNITIEESYTSFFNKIKNKVFKEDHFLTVGNEKIKLDLNSYFKKNKNFNFNINKKIFKESFLNKNYFYENKDNIMLSYICFLMSDCISKTLGCNIVINHRDKNCLIQIKSVHKKINKEVSEEKSFFNYIPESF